LKHGLTAKKIVVTSMEDPAEYEALVEALRQDFQPQTSVEELLIQQMASSIWRRQRTVRIEKTRIESDVFDAPYYFDSNEQSTKNRLEKEQKELMDKVEKRFFATSPTQKRWREKLTPKEREVVNSWATSCLYDYDPNRPSEVANELKHLEETHEQRKSFYIETQHAPNLAPLTIRYESTLERQFYRALFMLLEIQRIRNHSPKLAPKTTYFPRSQDADGIEEKSEE